MSLFLQNPIINIANNKMFCSDNECIAEFAISGSRMVDSLHNSAQLVGSATTMHQCASMVKGASTSAYMATMDNPFHPNSTDGDYNCYAITEGSSNNKIIIPDTTYQSCFLKGTREYIFSRRIFF